MRYCLFFFISLWVSALFAKTADFSQFNKLLKSYVKVETLANGGLQTSFDYKAAHSNPKTKELLLNQKNTLTRFNPQSLENKEEALAFWINSYNFFMISVILEKGFKNNKLNVDGVKSFGSWLNPYAIFKKEDHNIGGSKYSLDKIEKGILLGDEYKKKGWKDARIHFAVNCASVGCPPLLNEIYNKESIDKVLNENIRKAFKTPRHLQIKGKDLHLTSLFKWYKKDFEEFSGSVRSFIENFADDTLKKSIKKTNDIEYIDYDWRLNKPSNF